MSTQLQEKFAKASDFRQKGFPENARLLCEEILAHQARHGDALNLLGLIAAQERDSAQAAVLFKQALQADPANPYTHCNLGTAHQELEQWEAAVVNYDAAVLLKPDFALAFNNRGNALRRLHRFQEALQSFERALEINSDFAEAYTNRGNVLGDLRRWEPAVASHDRALALQPDFAEGHCNRGLALKALNRPAEALTSFDNAIALKPNYAEAHVNRGNILCDHHEFDAATASYNRAIAIQADHATAHVNRSLLDLLNGNFERGWAGYERRTQYATFAQPQWSGDQPLAGQTILLHHEQGLGDTLQFCRYAKLLADRQATVILGVQKPLLGLLTGLAGVSHLVSDGDSVPKFDYHCPLLSLPFAFGTQLSTIPAPVAYLEADALKTARWRTRLSNLQRPCIGLVWSGNVDHANDRARGVPLPELLAHLPVGFHYVSLQKSPRAGESTTLRMHAGIADVAEELHDFSDTAALCENLDLVITVDTSVAHLNGALGNKTWLLLPFNPDWRWLLRRTDSPWYPTMRLYRQPKPGDWRSVLSRVAGDLIREFAA